MKTLCSIRGTSGAGDTAVLLYGLRLGELCALKWGDIDFETGTMSISRTVSRVKNFQQLTNKSELLVGMPKSRKSMRKIPSPVFC